jgi:arabinose-5-phosphate isomerase
MPPSRRKPARSASRRRPARPPCWRSATPSRSRLLDARGFGADDFARSHPGGSLGRRLLTHVRDVMRTGDDSGRRRRKHSITEAIREITRGSIGMTVVVSPERKVLGIFTDGDLRRAIAQERIDLQQGLTVTSKS